MPSILKSPLESLQSQSSSPPNSHPVATTSSFSSFMSNPLGASFQTFTNLLPSSWGGSRSPVGSYEVLPDSSSTSRSQDRLQSTSVPTVEKRGPRFVSKEKQLEKLRSRLEGKDINGDVSSCNSCQDRTLFV